MNRLFKTVSLLLAFCVLAGVSFGTAGAEEVIDADLTCTITLGNWPADTAPEAVNNFIFLAGSGWFNGIRFQDNEEGFLIRAGGSADPGYRIENGTGEYTLADGAGYIGIQNSASGRNAGSFFITYDIPAYFKAGIAQEIEDEDIAEEVIDQYLRDKLARFSKTNTVFGRVVNDDLEKLLLLKNGVVINSIKILP